MFDEMRVFGSLISGRGPIAMDFRTQIQLAEAMGPVNRWFCSECNSKPVDDPEELLRYYIKTGGAADFARRYEQAMGMQNRWYCSQLHQSEVRDPQTLWDYYMRNTRHTRTG